MISVPLLKLRDELDSGTCLQLPEGVRKIIGGYCGAMLQTNFSLRECFCLSLPPFSACLFCAATLLHCLKADSTDEESEATFQRLAVGDWVDAFAAPKWYHAKIVEKKDGQVKVHYEGWADRYDT